MKLTIGHYDVTITARHTICEDMTHHDATRYLLNHLSSVLNDASKYMRSIGYDALADDSRSQSDQIYDVLKADGFYDNVRG